MPNILIDWEDTADVEFENTADVEWVSWTYSYTILPIISLKSVSIDDPGIAVATSKPSISVSVSDPSITVE